MATQCPTPCPTPLQDPQVDSHLLCSGAGTLHGLYSHPWSLGRQWGGRRLAHISAPLPPHTPHLPCSNRRLPLAAAPACPSLWPCEARGPRDGELNGNAAARAVPMGQSPWLGGRKRGLSDPHPGTWPNGGYTVASGSVLPSWASGRASSNTSLAGAFLPFRPLLLGAESLQIYIFLN